jgi:hypothetical protein
MLAPGLHCFDVRRLLTEKLLVYKEKQNEIVLYSNRKIKSYLTGREAAINHYHMST